MDQQVWDYKIQPEIMVSSLINQQITCYKMQSEIIVSSLSKLRQINRCGVIRSSQKSLEVLCQNVDRLAIYNYSIRCSQKSWQVVCQSADRSTGSKVEDLVRNHGMFSVKVSLING